MHKEHKWRKLEGRGEIDVAVCELRNVFVEKDVCERRGCLCALCAFLWLNCFSPC